MVALIAIATSGSFAAVVVEQQIALIESLLEKFDQPSGGRLVEFVLGSQPCNYVV